MHFRSNRLLYIASLLFLAIFNTGLKAQWDSLVSTYSFINKGASVIEFPEHIKKWGSALYQLQTGKKSKLTVVHMGDSHVQAGSFSEPLRIGFQSLYGNGGRGAVFPYQAAGTNGPLDYSFSSNQKWLSKRNCIAKVKLPTGLAGHTIYNRSRLATLDFRLRDSLSADRVTEIKIYHASVADSNFKYVIHLPNSTQAVSRNENLSNHFVSVFKLTKPAKKFSIKVDEKAAGRSSTLFGVILNNEKSGISVHSIGVNGAEYQHFLYSEYFTSQLSSLYPDLLIISLGTNEAFNTLRFEPLDFSAKVDSFLTRIQFENPELTIILTSPPAISQKVKSGKKKFHFVQNKNIVMINEILKHQAKKHQCGFWDFYQVMGGYNSMSDWAAAGLTDARRIHFSRKGYTIQGKLLFEAILKEIKTTPNVDEQ